MKALRIAWKDTLIRFRDWKAVIGLLGAPLVISSLIGLAFGNLNTGQAPLQAVPIAFVNKDEGALGQVYVDVFNSPDLADLLNVEETDDLVSAKARVEDSELRAVVYIPQDFSASILPSASSAAPDLGNAAVQVFTDPTSEVSSLLIQSIVDRITSGLNTILLAGQVSAEQTAQYAQILGPRMADLQQAVATEVQPENFDFEKSRFTLEKVETGRAAQTFDAVAYFVPGMAVFFLLFSMFDGARSILLEESRGTLPRLMTTPTPTGEIILGKMGGTFLTGILQFSILLLASSLIFHIDWGPSLSALLMIMVLTVFAAAGLGALVTAFARNPSQAGIIGTTVSLVFGALGGTFFPVGGLSGPVDAISKLTLSRWAMDAFTKLITQDAGFRDVLPQAGILAVIGAVTFVLALFAFKRRFTK